MISDETVAIEGNGCRPSHQGIGYKESKVMYTLNITEVHAVAYRVENSDVEDNKSKQRGRRK